MNPDQISTLYNKKIYKPKNDKMYRIYIIYRMIIIIYIIYISNEI